MIAKPKRRALVTGGAGFLGCHLVKRLASEGWAVTVLDDYTSPSPLADHLPATIVVGSVVSPPSLDGPFDLICHLASPASPPRYLRDPVGTLRTGGEGMRQVLDMAADWGAHVLFTSTSEIYGDPEVHPQPESYVGAVDVQGPRACYDEGKRYAEAMVYAYRRAGLHHRSSVVRLFNTYGPGMHPDDGRVVTAFLGAALADQPLPIFGDGSQTRSFCYVDDVIDGLMGVLAGEFPGPLNIGNDVEVSMLELADVVEHLIGSTGRQFLVLPDGDPKVRRPELSAIRELTGWKATTDLATGLSNTIAYLRELT